MIQQFSIFVGVDCQSRTWFLRSFCYLHRNKRSVVDFRVKPKTNIVILCHKNAMSLQFTSLKLFLRLLKSTRISAKWYLIRSHTSRNHSITITLGIFEKNNMFLQWRNITNRIYLSVWQLIRKVITPSQFLPIRQSFHLLETENMWVTKRRKKLFHLTNDQRKLCENEEWHDSLSLFSKLIPTQASSKVQRC